MPALSSILRGHPAADLTVVTGVGYRVIGDNLPEEDNVFETNNVKGNIGAWTSAVLLHEGFDVLMVARTESKLQRLARDMSRFEGSGSVSYHCADVLNSDAVSALVDRVGGRPVNLVHSVGLSAGAYHVEDDNPYLPVQQIPDELPTMEFDVIVRSLLLLVKELMAPGRSSQLRRIVVVSSMSGVRPFPLGFSHASAKAGLHHAVRSLALELNGRGVSVSEVLPGIVDTGMYDHPRVQDAVTSIGRAFGYDYRDGLPMMHPAEVGRSVHLCLSSSAHILSVNLVAPGQWPHAGA